MRHWNLRVLAQSRCGIGTVVVGLTGLGFGSLIGGCTARDLAMVVGPLGGALAGNEVQKEHYEPVQAQRIVFRVRSGVLVAVTQPFDARPKAGQTVFIKVIGDGASIVLQ